MKGVCSLPGSQQITCPIREWLKIAKADLVSAKADLASCKADLVSALQTANLPDELFMKTGEPEFSFHEPFFKVQTLEKGISKGKHQQKALKCTDTAFLRLLCKRT